MHTFIHLILASTGFIIIGGTSFSWITRSPNSSHLWAIPTTIFIFIPSFVAGAFIYNWAIKFIARL